MQLDQEPKRFPKTWQISENILAFVSWLQNEVFQETRGTRVKQYVRPSDVIEICMGYIRARMHTNEDLTVRQLLGLDPEAPRVKVEEGTMRVDSEET